MSDFSAILTKAANLLERPGAWTQGTYGLDADEEGEGTLTPQCDCLCIYGGVTESSDGDWGGADGAMFVLTDVLGSSPIAWNDEPGRTQAEVVALLRKAAASVAPAVAV